MFDRVAASTRYAFALRRILTDPISPEQGRARITEALENREEQFLTTLDGAVYRNPRSPYKRLLQHADISMAKVTDLVAGYGLEGALERLYDAGVYVTAAEFKGRTPICRPGLEFVVAPSDFDNPLADGEFPGQTSGSSGMPIHVFIGFDSMEYEASHYAALFDAHGIAHRPLAYWHAALHTALKTTFRHAKCGRVAQKWFTPSPFRWTWRGFKEQYVLGLTLILSRLFNRPLPRTEYVPRGDVLKVAKWLAEKAQDGRPAVLETNHSQAVRVCLAAKKYRLNIGGTVFHATGEPYTPAKAAVVLSAGSLLLDRYANVEVGAMGLACASPATHDDMHFLSDKLAIINRSQPDDRTDSAELIMTSLASSTPKLMLNVHTGDHAAVEKRNCGCPLGAIGLSTHLRQIRASDKLTSEGATFRTSQLLNLLEEVLPSHFGGSPTDYQLVEEEEEGLPRVSLVVRPEVGLLEEREVLSTIYDTLKQHSPGGAAEWRQSSTLRIIRRDPYETGSAKILPLHVI